MSSIVTAIHAETWETSHSRTDPLRFIAGMINILSLRIELGTLF